MKTILCTLALSATLSIASHAQTKSIDELLQEGIALHDEGQYEAAIDKYKQALKQDKKNPTLNYELSLSYYTMGDYTNTIKYCDAVIKAQDIRPGIKVQAYLNKGSALDMLGKPDQAVKAYEAGIGMAPTESLLYYNLGLTQFNQKNYTAAEEALVQAVQLSPKHSSSHLLLSLTMRNQGKRVQSLLAMYNFLLLEPTSKRAAEAYTSLKELQQQGLSQPDNKTINISLGQLKDNSGFSAAEMFISLSQASSITGKKEGKTEEETFAANTTSFFNILSELRKDNKGF